MALHKNLKDGEIHKVPDQTYADISARDADTVWNTNAGNIDKDVRVDSPLSYYRLTSITPTWARMDSKGFDTLLELSDFPDDFVGDAGKVLQVNSAETALEFGQQLRITDSPQFAGLSIGASTPFLDTAGVLTLQDVDVLDAITEATIENAIDALPNLVTIQGQNLTVEAASILNQDLTTDANPQFANLTLTGDLTVQGATVTLDTATLLVEDKNIEMGNVATPTDVTADGGGITLKGDTDKTITWLNSTDRWTFNQGLSILSNTIIGSNSVNPDGVLHIHAGSSGSITASSVANALVVEDSTNNGISILTPAANSGRIIFGSPSDPFGAFLAWSDSVNDFAIGSSKIGANFRLTSDQETTNLTLSGGAGSELATFAKDVTITGQIKIEGGTPGIDRVLTAVDANGLATWQPVQLSVGWISGGGVVSLNNSADSVAIGTGGLVDSKLHVESGSAGTVAALAGTVATFESAGDGFISILTPDASTRGILFGEPASNLAGGIFYNDPGSPDGFQFRANGGVTKMVIESDGSVGIGTTNPSAKLEINGQIKITQGTPGAGKRLTSDANGLGAWEEPGTSVVQETFASTNVRFFGELGVPQDQGWTDTATGIATIDVQDQTVFGVLKQVVRHNDDTGGGSTTSKIALTTQNWIDINDFGASYSGISRLDTVDGANGFFSGLQANAAENPLATGNRRYGILFDSNAGNLRLIEADNTGNNVTMDGTGGNPLITFDEWFRWECVVPAGLGAAEVYINGILTTFVPTFFVNGGGLGTQIIVSSGSTGGANRISYHDNFGTTIFEESATRTLDAATMAADVAQVNIPEGKRDYTIILPDGNPRSIGSLLRLVVNNLFGTVTLQNQTPAAPEALFNGLAEIVFTVFSKEIVGGVNTVDQANVYIGFKAEDVTRATAIFAQLHSIIDQTPTDTNPTVITYTNHDSINGIGHSTTLNTGELEILPGLEGTYSIIAQPQVGKDSGGIKVDFSMFLQVDRGSGFVDEPNSNITLTIKDSDITDVIVSVITIPLQVGDKIRMMQVVSNSTVGMGLKNTDPVVGPPTVPRTPSIIFGMVRIGGI